MQADCTSERNKHLEQMQVNGSLATKLEHEADKNSSLAQSLKTLEGHLQQTKDSLSEALKELDEERSQLQKQAANNSE